MSREIENVLAALDGFRMSDQMDYAAYSQLHDLISELDVAEPSAREWISVEDRLPEPFECVLIATDAVNAAGEEFVTIGAWEHDTWKCLTGPMEAKEKVTHWKPLPEPPEVHCDE